MSYSPLAGDPTLLALIAYAPGGILRGALDLRRDRLADLLEEGDPLPLTHAARESSSDGAVEHLGVQVVGQDGLAVVIVGGPVGNPARQVLTRVRTVRIVVAGYRVLGRIHVPPGVHPEQWAAERRWLALTGVVVRYESRGVERVQLHDAVLVNGRLVDSFEPADSDAYEQERLAVLERFRRPLPLRAVMPRSIAVPAGETAQTP